MKDVLAQKEHQVELSGDFFDELHDGSILCQLLNSLQPGLVKGKFEKPTTMPFKQVGTIKYYSNHMCIPVYLIICTVGNNRDVLGRL